MGALRAWIQVPRGVIVEYARNFPARFPTEPEDPRRKFSARALPSDPERDPVDGVRARTCAPGGGKIFITRRGV